MSLKPSKINSFLFLKLPAAWWCGVRVVSLDSHSCRVAVTHRWINQNPFGSMFWAVQGMAAELSTGALVLDAIQDSGKKVSMLVVNTKASFSKKAKGRIVFDCFDGTALNHTLERSLLTAEPQTIWMKSTGLDGNGDQVALFEFQWTLKLKQ